MGDFTRLMAADGHELGAYRAHPPGAARGAIVVIQEIFGVNEHIRRVTDDLAARGFRAIAPALFDRIESDVELDYSPAGVARGRELKAAAGWDLPLVDVAAAADAVREDGKVGVVGYCWGGSLAFLAASGANVDAAVGYYGSQIPDFLDRAPRAPLMLHFGDKDASLPPPKIEAIRAAVPTAAIYTYPAEHGFNCDLRSAFHPESARSALGRTLTFFGEHLA